MVCRHPAYALGLGLGSGLSPKAPGTVGTVLGWMLFIALDAFLPARALAVVVFLSIPIGWWACTLTASQLRMQDPGCIVWDEIAAFWLLLWGIENTLSTAAMPVWAWHILAFAGFRFFDAVKPPPVNWADRIFRGAGMRGGWGIMFDDVIAAGCTYFVLGGVYWALL